MSHDEDNPRRIDQTPEYLAGFLDAKQDAERTAALAAAAEAEREAGIVRTPNGVFRPSDDSGIMITVTQPSDPAYALLKDGHTTTPKVYRKGCYICEDPEFAQMGLPLCRPCPRCQDNPAVEGDGHVAADDTRCDECGYDEFEAHLEAQERGAGED